MAMLRAALYCRLSKDDMLQGDSESIKTQKAMLTQYAKEHSFLVVEIYVDDGYSGLNFDRPSFNRMLDDIEAGKIDVVITKDLSRLGRDHLKVGHFTEIYFPMKNVRYIAVNDGVDTANKNNDIAALKNVMNEFYSRDNSRKIRSSIRARAKAGLYRSSFNPIGYRKSPDNHNKLMVDEETAWIVKRIFELANAGMGTHKIAAVFREEQVPCPSWWLHSRGEKDYSKRFENPENKYEWSHTVIRNIISNPLYLGHCVMCKTESIFKVNASKKVPKEDWITVKNTHEPLVDEETFELAQKRIATRHRPTKAAEIDIFSGLLFCAGCRHKMYYQQGVNIEPRKFSYSCGAWRNRARTGSECTSHYIRKNVLLDLVLEDMRRVLRYVKEHEQDFICKATEYGDMEARKALAQQQKELFKAQARMTELDTLFRKLYEDNALGRLTDERFVFLTSGYEDEKKSLAARIDELQQQIATVTERKRDISRFIQIVGKYSDIQELTYENVHEFIDRILIHELDRETNTRKIEIHYSFVGQVDTEQEPTQVVFIFNNH